MLLFPRYHAVLGKFFGFLLFFLQWVLFLKHACLNKISPWQYVYHGKISMVYPPGNDKSIIISRFEEICVRSKLKASLARIFSLILLITTTFILHPQEQVYYQEQSYVYASQNLTLYIWTALCDERMTSFNGRKALHVFTFLPKKFSSDNSTLEMLRRDFFLPFRN